MYLGVSFLCSSFWKEKKLIQELRCQTTADRISRTESFTCIIMLA
jgi:hypothetical protein